VSRVVRPGWLLLCGLTLVVASMPALALPPGTVDPIKPAPDLALTTTEGTEFRLSQQRGKVVVLTFGFTLCPDVCPTTLTKLAQVRAQLGAAAGDVRVVFVTLDPERDSADRLREYARRFDPTFVGLTGTPRAVAQARDAYGVIAAQRTVPHPLGYLVDHSTFVFVVDRAGQLRLMFHGGATVEDMRQGIGGIL
jgi:protein SCO1/2